MRPWSCILCYLWLGLFIYSLHVPFKKFQRSSVDWDWFNNTLNENSGYSIHCLHRGFGCPAFELMGAPLHSSLDCQRCFVNTSIMRMALLWNLCNSSGFLNKLTIRHIMFIWRETFANQLLCGWKQDGEWRRGFYHQRCIVNFIGQSRDLPKV